MATKWLQPWREPWPRESRQSRDLRTARLVARNFLLLAVAAVPVLVVMLEPARASRLVARASWLGRAICAQLCCAQIAFTARPNRRRAAASRIAFRGFTRRCFTAQITASRVTFGSCALAMRDGAAPFSLMKFDTGAYY